MAISAADRARQSNRISEVREEAEEKEVKVLKRKNEQIKRAEKKHQEEVAKLTEAYRNQLGKIREEQKEAHVEREKDHQEDLTSLQKNYTSTLQNKIESKDLDRKVLKETYEMELGKQKNVSKVQREKLLEAQANELQKRDGNLGVVTINAREKMQEAIDHASRRLRDAKDKEVGLLQKNSDERKLQSELDKSEMRKAHRAQKNMVEKRGEYAANSWKQRYESLYNEINETNSEGQNAKGALLAEGLKDVRNKFEQKLARKTEELDESNAAFRDSVAARVDDQVRSKDVKISNMTTKFNNQLVNDKRFREIDRKNLQNVYENKMRDLENQRDTTKEMMQELNKERIDYVVDKGNEVLRETIKDSRAHLDVERTRFRENLKSSNNLQDENIARATDRAETRVEKLQKIAELNTKRLASYYDDNIDLAREGFERKVTDQRERNIELQGQKNRIMSERFRKIENTYSKKLEVTANNYETKLQEMKDLHEKEIRRLEGASKLRLEDKDKGHRTEKDSIEMKYETKIAMMEKEQAERLERVQKRHQEELRDLALKMNQYNRKA